MAEDLVLQLTKKEHVNILSDVFNACVNTAQADNLKLVEGNGKVYEGTKGGLNVMVLAPPASGKSTFLDRIPAKARVEMFNYTFPGMVGTINKNGQHNPGFIEDVMGKCGVVDEFHRLQGASRGALLSILEQGKYFRVLAYPSNQTFRKKHRFGRVICEKKRFGVDHVRCTFLFSGIYMPRKRMDDKAWSSRSLPVAYTPTLEEVFDILRGRDMFSNVRIRYEPYQAQPVFEDYYKFLDCYYNVIKSLAISNKNLYGKLMDNLQYVQRGAVHFSRLFSWASRGCGSVVDWEKYVPYMPVFLYNYMLTSLTLTEFEILCGLKNGMSQKEIAQRIAVQECYVSEVAKGLRGAGLVQ